MTSLSPGTPGHRLALVYEAMIERLAEMQAKADEALIEIQKLGSAGVGASIAVRRHIDEMESERFRLESSLKRVEHGKRAVYAVPGRSELEGR